MQLLWRQMGAEFPGWLSEFSIGFTSVSPLAFVLCMACTGALLMGVKESATLNKIMTVVNVSCILFIILLGSSKVDPANWTIDAVPVNGTSLAPADCVGSHKGFVPCGLSGVLLGSVKVTRLDLSQLMTDV